MNDTKFTPGPWHTWYEEMEISIYDQNSDLICGPIKQCPEQEANAHLIAAAPDMYKALEEIEHSDELASHIAKDALAKARGEL
jgi:hypothetical protein